jgi:spore germination protein KC
MTAGGSQGGGDKSAKSNPNVVTISSSGQTIDDDLNKIQRYLDKRLFYGYMEVMIIGEYAAEHMLTDFMGLNDRTPRLRTTVQFAIAEGTAQKALSTQESFITTSPGHYINEVIDKSSETGNAASVIVQDFIEYMEEEGIEPIAPRIRTFSKEGKASTGNSLILTDETADAAMIDKKEGYHSISGMALAKGDKFVGWMDDTEARGLSWITGRKMAPIESYKTLPGAKSNGILDYKIAKTKSRIKVSLENGQPSIVIDVYAESADLRKFVKTLEPDYLTPTVIDMLQKDLEEKIRAEIEASLKKGQKELKTDVFGFGQAFSRQHTSQWRSTYKDKWDKIFSDIPVTIKVKAKLITTGTNIKKFFIK